MIFFWLALFGAAGIYVFVKNIGVVILAFAILYVVLSVGTYLFARWPVKTLVAIAIFILMTVAGFNILSTSKINNTPVAIYQATDTCVIYNEMHELVQIPAGAIVARYKDPERESKEVSVIGKSDMCFWFDGELNSTTVSINHAMDYWIEELDYEPNVWNLLEIKEITYKEFQKSNWWAE